MTIDPNLFVQLLIGTLTIGLIGLVFSFVSLKRQRKLRELSEFMAKQIEDLEEIIARRKEFSEINTQRIAEQGRKIAWIETRIRQPKASVEDALDEAPIVDSPKPTMTERRHRVISLASRGQNIESIANSLGMLSGEVELIVDMNKAAINQK